jgi:hypothetical protein
MCVGHFECHLLVRTCYFVSKSLTITPRKLGCISWLTKMKSSTSFPTNKFAFQTYNCGEYTSHHFFTYCVNLGIKRQFTTPYILQHNGATERCNRSLFDITQCFFLDKGLLQFLWGKVIQATCCVLNLKPTKFHHDKTLAEFFLSKKPLVAHLHVFRSAIYVHNNKPNQGKLAAHSEKCTLFNHEMTRSKVIVVINHPSARSLFLEMSRLWRFLIQSSKTMVLLLLITLTTHFYM